MGPLPFFQEHITSPSSHQSRPGGQANRPISQVENFYGFVSMSLQSRRKDLKKNAINSADKNSNGKKQWRLFNDLNPGVKKHDNE